MPVVLKPLLGLMVFRTNEEQTGACNPCCRGQQSPHSQKYNCGQRLPVHPPYQAGAGPASNQKTRKMPHFLQVQHLFPPLAFLPLLP